MSLAINTDEVVRVKIGGEWLIVADGNGISSPSLEDEKWRSSFGIDAYEFFNGETLALGGGQCDRVASAGFQFITETGRAICGPLTAITALELRLR